MKLPLDLLQRIHSDYVGIKYRDGSYALQSLEDETIRTVLLSFISWSNEKRLIKEDKLDLSPFND